jgi:hypothetical protein
MLASAQRESRKTLWALLLVMAAGYWGLNSLVNGGILTHEPLDSYTLQAYNWLHGRMYVADGEYYTWLELAIYQGQYYVSFPPIPSVVMLPLTAIWGLKTPNNLLIALYGLTAAALAYAIMVKAGRSPRVSAFWALFTVWGSSMLWMTTNGGVWFQAQALNMVFCLAAVLSALSGRRALSTTLLALAVGCRPMSGLFLPIFAVWFVWQDKKEYGLWRAIIRQWPILIGPVLIGLGLMGYNYARFGSPLEFGHNYLPEFTRAEHGQFYIGYLWPNLKRVLFSYPTIANGHLEYDIFNGFAFYLANPLFLVLFVWQIVSLIRKQVSALGLLVTAGILLELVLLCLHKTLGGWQWGSRYACDMLPWAVLYLAQKAPKQLSAWELTLGGMAVALNAYGVIYMYLYG